MSISKTIQPGDSENGREKHALEQRLKELTFLNRIGEICSNAENEDDLLASATQALADTFYPDNCGFLLLAPDRNVLVTHGSFVLSDPSVGTEDKAFDTGIVGQVARTGIARKVNDVRQCPDYLAADPRTRSELCIPMKIAGHVSGVLNVESKELNAFGDVEERLMTATVDLVSNSLERLRAVRALEDSEQLFRSVVQNQTECICRSRPDCTLIWVNDAYASFFGRKADELNGVSFLQFIPEQEWPRVQQFFSEFTRECPIRTHEHCVTTPTGERWQQWTNRAFFDDEGNVTEFLGVARDITDRKQTEAQLRDSEIRYRTLVETSNDAIFVLDETGRIRAANPAAARMHGYTVDEFLQMNIRELDTPDSAVHVEDRMAKLKRGETLTFEVRHFRKDGTTLPLEVSASATEIGGEWMILSFDRDITRRKQHEEDLRQSRAELAEALERLELAVTGTSDGLWDVDLEEKMVWISPRGLELLGLEPKHAVTDFDFWFGLIPPEDVQRAERALKDHLERDVPYDVVHRMRRSNGENGWFRSRARATRDSYGNPIRMSGSFQDVTERREFEQRLKLTQHVVDTAVDAVFFVNKDGSFSYVNQKACDDLGYSQEELLQLTVSDINPSVSPQTFARHWDEIRESAFINVESVHRRKDGSVFDCEVRASRVTYGDHDINLAIVRDITKRKIAEEALRDNEKKLTAIAATMPQALYVFDIAKQENVFSNREVWRDLGYTEDEFNAMGAGFMGVLLHPDDLARLPELLSRWESASDGEVIETEYRMRHASGEWRWFLGRDTVYTRDKDGRVTQFIGTAQDITERKRAEDRLKLTQHAVDVSSDAVFFVHRDGSFGYVNHRAAEYLGYTRGELSNMSVSDIDLHVLPDQFADVWNRTKAAGSQSFESVHRRKDGSFYDCEIRVTYVSFGDQEFNVATVRDITERKRAEQELLDTRDRLTEAQTTAKLGSFYYELADQSLSWSDELYRIFGLDPGNGISLEAYLDRIDQSDQEQVRSTVERVIETGENVEHDYWIIGSDGERRCVHARVTAVRDTNGSLVALQGISQDITERKRAEEKRRELEAQVLHAQKLESLGVMAGGIAHDFNNLLTAMLGYADLASRQIQADSPARFMLDEISVAARKAAELTKQMMAYAGRGSFEIKPIQLDEVVAEIMGLMQSAVSHGADFSVELEPATIEGDATQISQLVMNLVTNASEALPNGAGSIFVRTGQRRVEELEAAGIQAEDLPAGDYAWLTVEDTGEGLTEETRERMFDPFFSTKFAGRGLGLAAVLGIVRSHRGVIDVQSEPGRGTRFEIFIPVADGAKTERADRRTPPATGTGIILVIEDEPSVREYSQQALEAAGFVVLSASNGSDGLSMFRQQADRLAAVLVDLFMPKVAGEVVLQKIRKLSDVPVLVMSGFGQQELATRLEDMPRCGFIDKPFDSIDLVSALNRLIGENK